MRIRDKRQLKNIKEQKKQRDRKSKNKWKKEVGRKSKEQENEGSWQIQRIEERSELENPKNKREVKEDTFDQRN